MEEYTEVQECSNEHTEAANTQNPWVANLIGLCVGVFVFIALLWAVDRVNK